MELMARQQNILEAIRSYGKQLFGFIRSRVSNDEDAEDILQDVWFQLSNYEEIEAIESVSGWLYRVAKNRIIDRGRKKQPGWLEDLSPAQQDDVQIREILSTAQSNPETENLRQLFWETLLKALEELPENQRKVFILNEIENKTLREIAELEGEKLKTIISRKRYAVRYLRERLAFLYNEIMNY